MTSLFLFIGCSKNEESTILEDNVDIGNTFHKRTINYSEFEKAIQKNKIIDLLGLNFGNDPAKGGDDFITEIKTDNIVEYSNDNLSTYTFYVKTQGDSISNYSKLVIKEQAGETTSYLLKYEPSDSYLSQLQNTDEFVPFDGKITYLQTDGTVLAENDVVNGDAEARAATTCTFSVSIIWNCAANQGHGPGGNCAVGGYYVSGMNVNFSCTTTGSGSTSTGTGTGTTGGSGGTGTNNGDPCYDCLPTDPLPGEDCTTYLCALYDILKRNDELDLDPQDEIWLGYQLAQGNSDKYNTFVNSCLVFLAQNEISHEAQKFVNVAIKTIREDGEVNFNEKIFIDKSFKDNAKMYKVYEKLMQTGGIRDILSGFYQEDNNIPLTFKVGNITDCISNDPNGCTKATYNPQYDLQKVDITIDSDYIYEMSLNDPLIKKNTPLLFLGRTLIHECIHASLFKAIVNCTLPYDSDFEILYDAYILQENEQHEIMAQRYLNVIASNLQPFHWLLNDQTFLDYYSDVEDWDWAEFYTYISWMGLKTTSYGDIYFQNPQYEDSYGFYTNAAWTNSIKNVQN